MARAVKGRSDLEDKLIKMGEKTAVARDEAIYHPGDASDSVYIVEEGRVKLAYLDESGKKLTLAMLDPGDMFGEMGLVGEDVRRQLATASEDSVVRRISCSKLRSEVAAHPEYFNEMLERFAERMRIFEQSVEDLAFKDIQTRLSRQLLRLSQSYGVKTKEGILIGFQITHKELADMIGSARENTTLALNRFQREGILDKSRYRIVITNEDGLREKCHMEN